jgi:ectoine hydroxylase-related dioxygenase (phytanoyl-CoA dioxygenase family)
VDLSFHPIVNDRPWRLTNEQIDHFNREGYLLGIRIFSPEEAARLLAFCEGPLTERMKADAEKIKRFISYHYLLPGVYDIATNTLLLETLRDLVGPNIVCHASQYICKRPGDQWATQYHQDASFNPLSHAKSVIVWLGIADADEENGCMRFIQRSQLLGPVGIKKGSKGFEVEKTEQYGASVSAGVKTGEVAILSDLLLHGAPANPSPTRSRPGFTFTCCSADVIPHKDWDKSSILCCGEDRHHR